MQLRLLGRDLAVGMQFGDPQIATVCQTANVTGQGRTTLFEQLEVVLAADGKVGRENGAGRLVDNHLGFLGVPLLFAAVVLALLFFGRSIGCSVASISTTSIGVSLA